MKFLTVIAIIAVIWLAGLFAFAERVRGSLFVIPMLYVVFQWLRERTGRGAVGKPGATPEPLPPGRAR